MTEQVTSTALIRAAERERAGRGAEVIAEVPADVISRMRLLEGKLDPASRRSSGS